MAKESNQEEACGVCGSTVGQQPDIDMTSQIMTMDHPVGSDWSRDTICFHEIAICMGEVEVLISPWDTVQYLYSIGIGHTVSGHYLISDYEEVMFGSF